MNNMRQSAPCIDKIHNAIIFIFPKKAYKLVPISLIHSLHILNYMYLNGQKDNWEFV